MSTPNDITWMEDRMCEICQYSPQDPERKNEEQYIQLKDEIESHFSTGEDHLDFDQLSPSAKDLVKEWEWRIECDVNEYNEAEQDERSK